MMQNVEFNFSFAQPPVQVYGVEGRYATALYSAATKQKQLETVEKEVNSFGVSIHFNTFTSVGGAPLGIIKAWHINDDLRTSGLS